MIIRLGNIDVLIEVFHIVKQCKVRVTCCVCVVKGACFTNSTMARIARKFHNKLLTMLHHGWAGGSSMAILK